MNRNQQGQLKDVIKQEYVRSASDPVYFLKKYCVIQHPMKGKVPFHLYNFQEKSIEDFMQHRFNIILKARQLGISTLTAGYALWMMSFHQDKNILVIATFSCMFASSTTNVDTSSVKSIMLRKNSLILCSELSPS